MMSRSASPGLKAHTSRCCDTAGSKLSSTRESSRAICGSAEGAHDEFMRDSQVAATARCTPYKTRVNFNNNNNNYPLITPRAACILALACWPSRSCASVSRQDQGMPGYLR